MKRTAFISMTLVMALVACGGGTGSGDDMLPKRGEMASDPTIVSATAHCGPEVSDGGSADLMNYITVRIDGSDPAGASNLGSCAATLDAASDQGSYGSGSSSACYAEMMHSCTVGMQAVIDLTVSNKTGGVTTASVSLTVGGF
jgi:hypothetical protein